MSTTPPAGVMGRGQFARERSPMAVEFLKVTLLVAFRGANRAPKSVLGTLRNILHLSRTRPVGYIRLQQQRGCRCRRTVAYRSETRRERGYSADRRVAGSAIRFTSRERGPGDGRAAVLLFFLWSRPFLLLSRSAIVNHVPNLVSFMSAPSNAQTDLYAVAGERRSTI